HWNKHLTIWVAVSTVWNGNYGAGIRNNPFNRLRNPPCESTAPFLEDHLDHQQVPPGRVYSPVPPATFDPPVAQTGALAFFPRSHPVARRTPASRLGGTGADLRQIRSDSLDPARPPAGRHCR